MGNHGNKQSQKCEDDCMVEMSREEFELLVGEALDQIPAKMTDLIDNVVIFVEDNPPPETPSLLGLYEGVPLTERGSGWGYGDLPDRITVYRNPILRMCNSAEQVSKEVLVTVVHEVAHYFGISDSRLQELGWG